MGEDGWPPHATFGPYVYCCLNKQLLVIHLFLFFSKNPPLRLSYLLKEITLLWLLPRVSAQQLRRVSAQQLLLSRAQQLLPQQHHGRHPYSAYRTPGKAAKN
jgi:hypothetical protein